MLVVWLCGYIGFSFCIMKMPPNSSTEQTDALIVPTGGATHRIKEALNLHAQGLSQHLFITGVHKDVTVNEIKTMHKGRLPDCCITLGHSAETTIENAEETLQWLQGKDIKSLRLITTNYHMPRAYLEFNTKLNNIKIIKHPVQKGTPSETTGRFWRLSFREYNKYIFRFSVIQMSKIGLLK